MSLTQKITPELVERMAEITKMPVTDLEVKTLQKGFQSTIEAIDVLGELDTTNTPITYQVTGLTNILREDVVDSSNTFTQKQALSNAKKTHRGYFLVPSVFS